MYELTVNIQYIHARYCYKIQWHPVEEEKKKYVWVSRYGTLVLATSMRYNLEM